MKNANGNQVLTGHSENCKCPLVTKHPNLDNVTEGTIMTINVRSSQKISFSVPL